MKIGILKEIKATEQRIILVPDEAKKLVESNHQVLIETGAGEYAGFEDSEYEFYLYHPYYTQLETEL